METAAVLPVAGTRLGSVAAGIRYKDRKDLVLIELAPGSTCAAVFTTNAFCAAPVIVAREHLATGEPRYLLINSGNANAGTGQNGLRAARETCKSLAAAAGCAMSQVLPFSTGVIGVDLPTNVFAMAAPSALAALDGQGWQDAARAIMTTDTVPKLCSRQIEIDGKLYVEELKDLTRTASLEGVFSELTSTGDLTDIEVVELGTQVKFHAGEQPVRILEPQAALAVDDEFPGELADAG